MNKITYTSFYVTYAVLITTGTITLVEALTTKNPNIRHIMNIETCISIIAAYFYSQFIKIIDNRTFSYDKVTSLRYTDWMITTPLMILSLVLVMSFETKKKVYLPLLLLLIIFDYGMLITGYLGEIGKIDRKLATIIGFVFFALLFGILWKYFLDDSSSHIAWFSYGVYVIVWAMYGLVYLLKKDLQNTIFNVLDLIAKCLVGIFFWLYFTNIIEL